MSSYLDSMGALGYNPLDAIQIALAGNAADMIKQFDRAARRGERLRKFGKIADVRPKGTILH